MKAFIKSFWLLIILFYGCSPSQNSDSVSSTGDNDSAFVFKATGNEPFWGLEIFENRKVRFHALAGKNFNIESYLPEAMLHIQDTLIYSFEVENDSLNISIIRFPCEDTMSGEIRPLNVTVSIKENNGDINDFVGCGKYLDEYEINGSWKLKSINNDTTHLNTGEGIPDMEIHLLEKRIFGFAGCNRFSGKVELINGKLHFGPIVSTKMACTDIEVENKFFETLSDKILNYSRMNGELILKNGETSLKFKRKKF